MPGKSNRGKHPQDEKLFATSQIPSLREAVADLSWMRTRGYTDNSSLKLVGDRYDLTARQRVAVGRCACSDESFHSRSVRAISPDKIGSRLVFLDGFNVLTTIEAAMAGGILLRGRDGCIRDMSSMHGNYRVLEQSRDALEHILNTMQKLNILHSAWYLDKPVSNSGRLKGIIEEVAAEFPQLNVEVTLVHDPDPVLKKVDEKGIVATADSGILDECGEWTNLIPAILENQALGAEVIDLSSC